MRLPILDRPILYVNQAFLQNPKPSPDRPEQSAYSGEGDLLRFDALGKSLRRLMKEFDSDPTKSDGAIAIALHQSLPLTRREAAQMAFWHYLSILELPEYVAWRYFDPAKAKTNKERYIGFLADNAFSRLWWWAELTHQAGTADPYFRTRAGAQNLELVKSVVENLFGGNRVLVAALIDFVCASADGVADQQKVKQLTTRINALLVTVAVDLLTDEMVQQIPRNIAATFQ